MFKIIISFFFLLSLSKVSAQTTYDYRTLISDVRKSSTFYADIPIAGGITVKYELSLGEALFDLPHLADFYFSPNPPNDQFFFRTFTDKIMLDENSFIKVGEVTMPATCIFVHGQDNRFSGKNTPLIPDFIIRYYIVANDFSCTGPINPSWPASAARKESWDTFVYFEVRDPSIMLPSEIKLRYRWNEYHMIKREN